MEARPKVRLLTIDEAAEMLRKTPAQLRWLRHRNEPPRSGKLSGRIVYRESDLLDYIDAAFEKDGAT